MPVEVYGQHHTSMPESLPIARVNRLRPRPARRSRFDDQEVICITEPMIRLLRAPQGKGRIGGVSTASGLSVVAAISDGHVGMQCGGGGNANSPAGQPGGCCPRIQGW